MLLGSDAEGARDSGVRLASGAYEVVLPAEDDDGGAGEESQVGYCARGVVEGGGRHGRA